MNEHVIDDGLARRFLLGELSPEEQGRIEELAFGDADVFVFLQAAENELMDDFLSGELSSEEKESFEKHFLSSSDRRRDLRIARALKQYLDRDNQPLEILPNKVTNRGPKVSFFQRFGFGTLTGPLAAAAVIIVAIGVMLLVIRTIRREEAPPLQAQQQQTPSIPTPSTTPAETPVVTTSTPVPKETPVRPSPSPRASAAPVFAIVLTPGAPPRSDTDDIVLPLPSGSAEFELPITRETEHQRFQALLQKNEQTIRSWENLRPQKRMSGKAVVITTPPGLFDKSERYRIVLNGVSPGTKPQQLHTYHFKISDKEIR